MAKAAQLAFAMHRRDPGFKHTLTGLNNRVLLEVRRGHRLLDHPLHADEDLGIPTYAYMHIFTGDGLDVACIIHNITT